MGELQEQALTAVSQKNLDEANAFLKKNAKEKDVIEIVPEKLQYIILKEGHEPAVEEHGSPQITYEGKYADGTVFGNSDSAGGPITVPLDQTIQGFSQGIKGMKEGEKRRLFVHPDLGYGTTGLLPPNSLLIFDVEVVKAQSPDKTIGEFFQGEESDDDLDEETDHK
jgi:peptidylprolyl isomerase